MSPELRDQRTAERRTRREAEKYPLLARLGLTRTWTAEQVAEERTNRREASELHEAAVEARFVALVATYRAACAARVDAETLAQMDAYVVGTFHGKAHYAADFWHHAADRLAAGGGAFAPQQIAVEPEPRRAVGADEARCALARFPAGASISEILDAGACPGATVLDVVAAFVGLRDQGLAEVRGAGWRLTAAGRRAA